MDSGQPCPRCHDPMQPGIIRAHAHGMAKVFWGPPDWKHDAYTDPTTFEELARDGFWVDVPGYRCPNCRIVLFTYPQQDTSDQNNG